MPAVGTQTGKPYTVRTRRARVPRVRKTPPRAPIYVPPAALSSPEARRAVREAKHPRHANVYVPPRSLSSKEARAATRYNVRVHQGEAAGPAAPPHYGIERRKREAAKRQAVSDRQLGLGVGLTPTQRAQMQRLAVLESKGAVGGPRARGVPVSQTPSKRERLELPKSAVSAGPGSLLGKYLHTVTHGDYGGLGVVTGAGGVVKRAARDVGEMAVTLPSSVAHEAVESFGVGKNLATGHPGKAYKGAKHIAGELAAPYVELAKHPVKTLSEHPGQTAAMLLPVGRAPGLTAGRVLRLSGKQTLKRAEATLPGTALRETRTGSRDAFVRRHQAKQDRKQPAALVSDKELKRRVDEHHDYARQVADRAEAIARRDAKRTAKTHGLSRVERKQAMSEAGQTAREHAFQTADERVAREFGATARPSVGQVEVLASRAERQAAAAHRGHTRAALDQAETAVKSALADARKARARRKRTSTLDALRAEGRTAQRALAQAVGTARGAEREFHRAHANARVSAATSKSSPRLAELHGLRRGAAKAGVPDTVKEARRQVGVADRTVNSLERELQREEQKASRLEGITEGRHAGRRMTMVAGRRTADQAVHIGYLKDALHEARQHASTQRENLKTLEHEHRGQRREATTALDRRIAEENRRLAGVAPQQHEALLSAIGRREAAPGHVQAARARVREVDQRIAAEQQRIAGVPPKEHQSLLSALARRDDARSEHAVAGAEHAVKRRAHIDTVIARRDSTLVKPADQGRLFANEQDARMVAKQLNAQGHEIPTGSTLPYQTHLREPGAEGPVVTATRGAGHAPLEFTVRKTKEGQYAVLPRQVMQRLHGGGGAGTPLSHASVGTGKATGAKLMRTSRRMFTQATLPLSLKWLGGQGAEAAVRAMLTGAGGVDYVRFNRVVKRMNELHPGSGDAFKLRIIGGQFGATSTAADQLLAPRTLAEEFQSAGPLVRVPAELATWVGGRPLPALVKRGWRGYTAGVMHGVNGLMENVARSAMAGHDLRHGPLMDEHLGGLTQAAVDDAAKGLKGTHNQVAAARAVDRMYGRYSKWSPEVRSSLLHWTPFLPWYLNAAKFLGHTLPVHHPMRTALLADIQAAQEDWRKTHHLDLGKGHAPGFLLGSYPKKGGGYYRIGHYTPWGIGADPAGAAADLTLPQGLGPVKNLGGVDFKWKYLQHEDRSPYTWGEKSKRALWTALEEQVPGFSFAGNVSGVTRGSIDQQPNVPPVGERLKALLPTTATKALKPKAKRQPASPGGWGGGGGGGGWGSSGSGSGGW